MIQLFNNPEFGEIRVSTDEQGEPWWVLSDVCKALNLSNPSIVAARLDNDERSKFDLGRQGKATIINESGLYNVIIRSDKPEAKSFKRWITHEVLPSIRKHGGYMVAKDESPEETMARAFLIAQETIQRKEARISELEPKAFFAESVSNSESLVLIRDLAHVLKQSGCDIGERRLFQRLRDDGYLEKNRNEPTQRALDQGILQVVQGAFTKPDGSTLITRTTKVTGKGQVFFVNKYAGVA